MFRTSIRDELVEGGLLIKDEEIVKSKRRDSLVAEGGGK